MTSSDDSSDVYAHPLVRDLEWLLSAPDLLTMPCDGRPDHRELGFDDHSQRVLLDRLERDPHELEIFMEKSRKARLGLYHERLWQFLLGQAPHVRLLANNLAIRREKRTLGELDMLYRRDSDGALVHLEVAIKFYLGLEQGPGGSTSQARWIGPSSLDSLAIKRERLLRHQLPLIALDETRAVLEALAAREGGKNGGQARARIEQRVALPGVLFYPWHRESSPCQPLAPPDEASVVHLRGTWLPWSQWPDFLDRASSGTRGTWLCKPHWLAMPPRDSLVSLDTLNGDLAKHFQHNKGPMPLALFDASGGGWRRIFVVPDDWPRQVPLAPWTTSSFTR